MLQGLPTSLFWQLDKDLKVDQRYGLSHLSDKALASLLGSFSSIGAKLNTLRRFARVPQTIPYMQTFRRDIEECLRGLNSFLSMVEMQYLQNATISVSLLQLLEDVRRESRLVLSLADLVSKPSSSRRSAQFLDQLYELVCISQATGDDDEFHFLSKLFFSCFETYIRPIQRWMETGCLDAREGAIFVVKNDWADELRTLWHEWHSLDEDSLAANTPRFLHSLSPKIFKIGKTMFFLRQLDVLPEDLVGLKLTSLTFQDIYPAQSPTPFYISFPELLEGAFERLVDSYHLKVSNALQNELNQRCGLWISLRALELIYLCQDMSILGVFDDKFFELIDRGCGAWNDRFLLTELARNIFGTPSFVDPSRLTVRSSTQKASLDSRSVNALEAVSIDYVLAWPLANIITKDSIHVYQRIFTLLTQIRRAKYMIVKQQTRRNEDQSSREDALGYALRHHLLWFLNVLYGHMTDLVISSTTYSMHEALSASDDIDAMIHAHASYASSLEEQLLLSKNLAPFYRAVVDLLDLCIRFADMQVARHGAGNSRGLKEEEEEEEYSDDDDEEESSGEAQDTTTTLTLVSVEYVRLVKDLKDQFDQNLAFLTAGLREIARVDGQRSWAMLAEKLEWRNPRFTRI